MYFPMALSLTVYTKCFPSERNRTALERDSVGSINLRLYKGESSDDFTQISQFRIPYLELFLLFLLGTTTLPRWEMGRDQGALESMSTMSGWKIFFLGFWFLEKVCDQPMPWAFPCISPITGGDSLLQFHEASCEIQQYVDYWKFFTIVLITQDILWWLHIQ